MDTKSTCSGIILAGGLSSRFGGRNKALIEIGGKTILQRLQIVFREFFNEVILVTNDPLAYADADVPVVTDIYNYRSSLTGLHAGLFYTTRPHAFFTACDTPFLRPKLIRLLLDQIDPRKDVVIPKHAAGFEPLCAVYSVRCLQPVTQCLDQRKFKIQNFFSQVKIKEINEAQLQEQDPDLVSFFNINTLGDQQAAEALLSRLPED